jgi:hypothetical protein
MERHIKREHSSDLRSLFLSFHNLNHQDSKFKSQNVNYYSSQPNFHSFSNIFRRSSSYLQDSLEYEQNNPPLRHENPFDASLEVLRKTAFISLQQQKENDNEEAVVANLYMKQLPELILRVVREWTQDETLLMAAEVPFAFVGCHEFIISNEKQRKQDHLLKEIANYYQPRE